MDKENTQGQNNDNYLIREKLIKQNSNYELNIFAKNY